MTERDLVLVVDDEPPIVRILTAALGARGFGVVAVGTGEAAIAAAAHRKPTAIILDLGLPDLHGVEVCRRIRLWSDVPIIVLTADDTEHSQLLALDEGADDYVTKPFSTPELLARLRVALRHRHLGGAQRGACSTVGDLFIDRARRVVRVGGRTVPLTPNEFAFLAVLAGRPGRVLTHGMILQAVWGPEHRTDTHYLRVYARQLRKKLADNPTRPRLVTEPGIGYRLVDPDQQSRLALR